MPQPLHTGRLVLTPEDPYHQPGDMASILALLQDIGFIGEPLAEGGYRYLLGENFMRLVSFMGCSPSILLQPGKPGQSFCHLVVDGPSAQPRLLHGKNTVAPRCAACRKRLPNWQTSFKTLSLEGPGYQAPCPYCGGLQDPVTYDFRQSAGCGCLFLCVEEIFPQEAIPAPDLLAHLWRATHQAWRYFYQQEA